MTSLNAFLSLSSFPPPLDPSLRGAFWLLLAILLLDLFDISLPRGDSVGVAGSLVGGAVVVVGPLSAGLMVLVSAVLAHVLRRGADSPVRLLTILMSRGCALLFSALVLMAIPTSDWQVAAFTLVPAVFLVTELASAQFAMAAAKGRPLGRLIQGELPQPRTCTGCAMVGFGPAAADVPRDEILEPHPSGRLAATDAAVLRSLSGR